MFDQITERSAARPWAVTLSFTLQAAVAGAVVLASIIQVQQIDIRGLIEPPPLVAPRRLPPEPVQIVSTDRTPAPRGGSGPVLNLWRPLIAPTKAPVGVPTIVDPPEAFLLTQADPGGGRHAVRGVPWGVDNGAVISDPPPPPPPARETKPAPAPIRVTTSVQEGRLVHKVIPTYPFAAKMARISGTVRLQAVVARDGSVRELQVVEGHPLLVNAAVEAVRQWRYRPAMLSGEPVEVVAPVEVRFTLN